MRTQFWLEGLMDRMNLGDLGVDEARTFKDVLLGTGGLNLHMVRSSVAVERWDP
jgi:hypothetical protein